MDLTLQYFVSRLKKTKVSSQDESITFSKNFGASTNKRPNPIKSETKISTCLLIKEGQSPIKIKFLHKIAVHEHFEQTQTLFNLFIKIV